MPLQKQPIDVALGVGIDTKTDPKQVQVGKLLSLSNAVFQSGGLLQKRNGYQRLPNINDTSVNTLTTFATSLTALGNNLYNYVPENTTWYNKGPIASVQLDVLPIVRSATNQIQQDAVVSPTGLICTTWNDSDSHYKYQIVDGASGQIVVAATNLPATATLPRAFVLGRYFIVTFLATVSAVTHLRYIAIPLLTPTNPGPATDIATNVTSLTAGYDGHVANNSLYLMWSATGPTVKVVYLDQTLLIHTAATIAGHSAALASVTADLSTPTPTIWVTYWDSGSNNIYSAAFSSILSPILASTVVFSTSTPVELTSAANNNILTVYSQNSGTYSYSSAVTDVIYTTTITQTGSVGTPTIILRGVGLASKAFLLNSKQYVLMVYGSGSPNNDNYQPTYFLSDSSGNIICKLAYSNGYGYPSNQILASATVSGSQVKISYLLKDLLVPINKAIQPTKVSGIYTQTGINIATITINDLPMVNVETANSLHMAGGFVWQYDGSNPVEHGFHLWPEDILTVGTNTTGNLLAQAYLYQVTYEWTDATGLIHRSAPSVPQGTAIFVATSFTADRTSGSFVLLNVSSFNEVQIGQSLSGTGIAPGAYIVSFSVGGNSITMSAAATSGSGTSTTITPTDISALQLDIPTLRLTYKIKNPVRIVIYRWSTAQQIFYQVTSIQSPLLNDPTVDSVTYTDTLSDSQILGNEILYTTGGVVENIAAPACKDIALYKTRAFLPDAEDENLLWYSKQTIENTPVEFSDLFTLFIAPTVGSQGSTGRVKVIAPMDDKNIFFKPNAIYYNTGNGPDNTGGNNDFSDPQFITATVGCTNPQSIVFQPQGLMFQSDKGIWLLGRDLSTTYIGAPVEAYNSATVLSANAIPGTNQVRFTLDTGITLMYDYYYGQWGTFTGVPALSATLYGGLHTYLNNLGQVFQENPGSYLDGSIPVLLSLTTPWIKLAGLQGFERFYQMLLLGEYKSPFKLNVTFAYDYANTINQSTMVIPNPPNPNYGNQLGPYGSGSPYGGMATVFEARVFPQTQKCESFQLTISELYDSSFGIVAGAGLTLSGIQLLCGVKKGSRTSNASRSFG